MSPKTVILSALGATALVGVGVWLAAEHQARLKLNDENIALRQQLDQLALLATDNERLSNFVAQASSSQSPSEKQLQELLRLRGEVGVLRRQGKEIEALRKENLQARAALANPPKTAGAVATADYWPRDSWRFAGYATPDAALQSALWSGSKGDVKTFLGGLDGEILQLFQKDLEGKSATEAAALITDRTAKVSSLRVLDRKVQGNDTAVLSVEVEEGNHTNTAEMQMKKIGNDWKLSGLPD